MVDRGGGRHLQLTTVFDRFARWYLVRTTIDIATASAAVWAVVVALD